MLISVDGFVDSFVSYLRLSFRALSALLAQDQLLRVQRNSTAATAKDRIALFLSPPPAPSPRDRNGGPRLRRVSSTVSATSGFSSLSRQGSMHSTAESVTPFSLVPSAASVAASLESLRVPLHAPAPASVRAPVLNNDSEATAESHALFSTADSASGDAADKPVRGIVSISRDGSRRNIAVQWRAADDADSHAEVQRATASHQLVDEEEMVAQAHEGTDVFDSDFMASPPPLPRRASTLIGGGLLLSAGQSSGGGNLSLSTPVKSQATSAFTPTAAAPTAAAATPPGAVGGRARKLLPAGATPTH